MTNNNVKFASATIVRDWARAQGHVLGDRGILPGAVQRAFNDAHAGSMAYYMGEGSSSSGVVTGPGGETAQASEIREAATAAGLTLPERGRLPKDVTAHYFAGTLAEYAADSLAERVDQAVTLLREQGYSVRSPRK